MLFGHNTIYSISIRYNIIKNIIINVQNMLDRYSVHLFF